MGFLGLLTRRGLDTSVAVPPALHAHVGLATGYADLECIKEPHINLAIWPRSIPPSLALWLDQLPYEQLPNDRIILDGRQERNQIAALVKGNMNVVTTVTEYFIGDITEIVSQFRQLTGCGALQLRLERIDSPACKKFHADRIGLRLLVTYRGAGTEWLPEHAVNRNALGCCENHDICKNYRAVQKLGRGHIGILKGSDYAHGTIDGIVHRSPSVKGRKNARLLLCLDKPYC